MALSLLLATLDHAREVPQLAFRETRFGLLATTLASKLGAKIATLPLARRRHEAPPIPSCVMLSRGNYWVSRGIPRKISSSPPGCGIRPGDAPLPCGPPAP